MLTVSSAALKAALTRDQIEALLNEALRHGDIDSAAAVGIAGDCGIEVEAVQLAFA